MSTNKAGNFQKDWTDKRSNFGDSVAQTANEIGQTQSIKVPKQTR